MASALLTKLALTVLGSLIFVASFVLYAAGAHWAFTTLVIVVIFLCLACSGERNGGGAGPGLGPVQELAEPGMIAALPRESAAALRGLGASAIIGLPAYAYEKKAGGGAECAVCLGEMQRGEVVKQLPACTHLFHAGCIDVWMGSHKTSPICRCPVVDMAATAEEAAARPQS